MDTPNTFVLQFQPDPRVKDWFLTNQASPAYITAILIIYLTFAFAIFPYMRNCHYELRSVKNLMNVHNILLLLINLFLASLFLWYIFQANYNMFCEPVKPQSVQDQSEMSLAILCWFYFLSKLFELNDIVFNIFRARPCSSQVNSQVYHHSTMVVLSWAGARYLPGGSTAIMSCINCSLHVIMYVYFAFSGKTLDCGGFLDARTVIIVCTIAQFILVICHCFTGIYLQCNYPTSAYVLVLVLVITYILGFNFRFYFCNCTIGIEIEEEEGNSNISENQPKTDFSDEEKENKINSECHNSSGTKSVRSTSKKPNRRKTK